MRMGWALLLSVMRLGLRLELVPKDLGVCDELRQELRVREDGLVDLVQFALVAECSEQLLVGTWDLVDVLSPTVVRRDLCCLLSLSSSNRLHE